MYVFIYNIQCMYLFIIFNVCICINQQAIPHLTQYTLLTLTCATKTCVIIIFIHKFEDNFIVVNTLL